MNYELIPAETNFFSDGSINHKIWSKPRLKNVATFPKTKQFTGVSPPLTGQIDLALWNRTTVAGLDILLFFYLYVLCSERLRPGRSLR